MTKYVSYNINNMKIEAIMEIYVVQPGDTITSIAEKYGVSEKRLREDNGFTVYSQLVVGQSVVILKPEVTYIVQEGDTLASIADTNNTTVLQLLRNNPFLSDREFLFPGEELVIQYGTDKRRIATNGYANPFISNKTLRKTLPYLTYLSIFGYVVDENADITEPEDEELLALAKEYQVAPIMVLSTLSYQGIGSIEAVFNIIYSEFLTEKYINNILKILKEKNMHGVNFIYSYLFQYNVEEYNEFTRVLKLRLNREGYSVWISLAPVLKLESNVLSFERIDYSVIGEFADHIIVMNYNWGYNFGPPTPVANVSNTQNFCDYLVTMINPEKMMVGLPLLGYDWRYPYLLGITRANAVTYEAAIDLAIQTNAVIQFDPVSKNPFYNYTLDVGQIPSFHIVWFADARTIDAMSELTTVYGFEGIVIWNIMSYFNQLWSILNYKYDIVTLSSETENTDNENG